MLNNSSPITPRCSIVLYRRWAAGIGLHQLICCSNNPFLIGFESSKIEYNRGCGVYSWVIESSNNSSSPICMTWIHAFYLKSGGSFSNRTCSNQVACLSVCPLMKIGKRSWFAWRRWNGNIFLGCIDIRHTNLTSSFNLTAKIDLCKYSVYTKKVWIYIF